VTYTQFIQYLNQLLVLLDATSQAMLVSLTPAIITYVENAMYRDPDFDFLVTRISDVSQITTNGSRAVPIPSAFIVIEGVSLIMPANTAPWVAGAMRIPLLRTTRQFIDLIWPTESQVQTPDPLVGGYFALFNEEQGAAQGAEIDESTALPSSILVAPTPDNAYITEFTGTNRPAELSAANSTNFLTLYLPDLYLAKAMEYATGALLHNFGAQADDPRQAMSWRTLYQTLKKDASIEEIRKKAKVDGASPYPPNPTMPNPAMLAQMAQAQAR
jgi:hypothetical protein